MGAQNLSCHDDVRVAGHCHGSQPITVVEEKSLEQLNWMYASTPSGIRWDKSAVVFFCLYHI